MTFTGEKFARYLARCPEALAAALREAATVTEEGVQLPREVFAAALKEHTPERRQDSPARQALHAPTVGELAQNFTAAVSRWIEAGAPVVSEEEYAARALACEGCELWDGRARLGLGKCRHKKCGCTRMKRWLATEKCPLSKWAQ